jgi:spermidine/putrescine transport system permease protein
VYYSFQTSADAGLLENYERAFQPLFAEAMWRSIRLAVICTVFCFLLGYPVGYILASKDFENHTFILFLFIVPMWMNFLLRTYAWLTLLETNGIINSVLVFLGFERQTLIYTEQSVILGMVYNFIPFMILPIYTSLKNMDIGLIEAAQDLGANKLNVFLRIIFPLSIPGVVSGVSMVFMPAVTTFVISDILGGARVMLIGNVIERQFLRVGDWGLASALSILLMVIVLITMVVFSFVSKDSVEDAEQGGVLH